jgi:hypothetical protein
MKKLFTLTLMLSVAISLIAKDYAASRSESYIMAQDFVKEKFKYPREVKFNRDVVHERDGYGKCIILGKLTAKNAFGVTSEYAYKIWLEYNGGSWDELKNWSYSKLIIEDAVTKEQQVYTGNTPSKPQPRQNTTTRKETTFLGLKCQIIEDTGVAIRIQTPRKLSEAEIKKGLTTFEFKNNRNPIQFCLKGKIKRGEEYASWSKGAGVLIFE